MNLIHQLTFAVAMREAGESAEISNESILELLRRHHSLVLALQDIVFNSYEAEREPQHHVPSKYIEQAAKTLVAVDYYHPPATTDSPGYD